MQLNGFYSILVFLFSSYTGLIINALVFCISIFILVIKRKTLKHLIKIVVILLAVISLIFIGISIYLYCFWWHHSKAVIGDSDVPMAIYITDSNDSNEHILQFDGVYYCEEEEYTKYFRFYENGTVIGLTSIGKYNEKILKNWSYENYDDIIGNYFLKNNSIYFSTYSGNNIIEYVGIINAESMILNSHSNINGKDENNKMYIFKKLEE